MSETTLKSCPFCGRPADARPVNMADAGRWQLPKMETRVTCNTDGCPASSTMSDVATWNRRSSPDAPSALLSKARKLLLDIENGCVAVASGVIPMSSVRAKCAELNDLISQHFGGASSETPSDTDAAIMNAIELTIQVCDEHEKAKTPHEARHVEYASILKTAKDRAARSSGSTREGVDTTSRRLPHGDPK